MKYLVVPFIILSIFTGIGCLNNANPDTTGPVPTTVAPQTIDSNSNKIQTTQATNTLPTTITTKTVSTAGLNPAHGQPGHRCDISVGAPLDSKPAQTQTTVQPQPVTTTPTPLKINPVTAGAGLNPAHGQPGHRCDIAVGAPLNSKPAGQ